jgi:electron transfer flavoprotein beta subunit
MNDMLKIAVLLAPGRHPVSGRVQAGASDAAAFELACSLLPPALLTCLCVHVDGTPGSAGLRPYAALGAIDIGLLAVPSEAELVPALLARLGGFDLVICGVRAEAQQASGLLPYYLAEGLGLPLVTDVLEARREAGAVRVRQFLPKGLRRLLELSGPAVLAVHPRAPRTRQHAYARAAAGRVTHLDCAVAAATRHTVGALWNYEALTRRPRPLKAALKQSGHSRMVGAIGGGDASAKGGEVVKQGNAVEKAQVLLRYLRDHGLVNF